MARIVGAFGAPHNPHFPNIVLRREAAAPEIERLYGSVASWLEEVRPDAIVLFTSDHYNIFFEESLPIFSVGVAESATGPSDYPELPRHEVCIHSRLARSIQAQAVASDFDVGMSQEFELDHSAIVPLHFLTPRMDLPIVPVFISAFIRPIPSARWGKVDTPPA